MKKTGLLLVFCCITFLGLSQADYPEPRQPAELTYTASTEYGKSLYINVMPYRYEVWTGDGDQNWRKADIIKSTDSTIFIKNLQDQKHYTIRIDLEDTKAITVLNETSGETIVYQLEGRKE